jgi:hypothetical protein
MQFPQENPKEWTSKQNGFILWAILLIRIFVNLTFYLCEKEKFKKKKRSASLENSFFA